MTSRLEEPYRLKASGAKGDPREATAHLVEAGTWARFRYWLDGGATTTSLRGRCLEETTEMIREVPIGARGDGTNPVAFFEPLEVLIPTALDESRVGRNTDALSM